MTQQEIMRQLIAAGNRLPYAKVYFRKDWHVYYFDIFGKMFGMMPSESKKEKWLTLKNLPEANEEWREMYPEHIKPGFHMNKKHWNTISLDQNELSITLLIELLGRSYELVCQNLNKEQKALLIEDLKERSRDNQ